MCFANRCSNDGDGDAVCVWLAKLCAHEKNGKKNRTEKLKTATTIFVGDFRNADGEKKQRNEKGRQQKTILLNKHLKNISNTRFKRHKITSRKMYLEKNTSEKQKQHITE